jgi:hypothetical protein
LPATGFVVRRGVGDGSGGGGAEDEELLDGDDDAIVDTFPGVEFTTTSAACINVPQNWADMLDRSCGTFAELGGE